MGRKFNDFIIHGIYINTNGWIAVAVINMLMTVLIGIHGVQVIELAGATKKHLFIFVFIATQTALLSY
jgi:hypothetical protein